MAAVAAGLLIFPTLMTDVVGIALAGAFASWRFLAAGRWADRAG